MGIWQQKGDPASREPITLINDPAMAGTSTEGDLGSERKPPWHGDLVADVDVDDGCEMPPLGSPVYIICRPDEPPTVWVAAPDGRRLGHLGGSAAQAIKAFVRTANGGLVGTLTVREGPTLTRTAQIRVPGREAHDD